MIGDSRLQAALAQLHGIDFWELDARVVQARVVGAVKLHQPVPNTCAECGHAWPCDTWQMLISGEPT